MLLFTYFQFQSGSQKGGLGISRWAFETLVAHSLTLGSLQWPWRCNYTQPQRLSHGSDPLSTTIVIYLFLIYTQLPQELKSGFVLNIHLWNWCNAWSGDKHSYGLQCQGHFKVITSYKSTPCLGLKVMPRCHIVTTKTKEPTILTTTINHQSGVVCKYTSGFNDFWKEWSSELSPFHITSLNSFVVFHGSRYHTSIIIL